MGKWLKVVTIAVLVVMLATAVVGCGGESKPSPTPTPPEASFTAEPTSGTAPLQVQFADQSTGEITAWAWDFGDGETSIKQYPIHTYDSVGTYTVCLTVTGPAGSDTETKADYIEAAFEMSSLQITPSEPVIGESVIITVDIHNSGDLEGAHAVSLRINGVTLDTKDVIVRGGATETVSFVVSEDTPGIYNVEVDGLIGTFEVQYLIKGVVFEDLDGDGSRDAGEEGIPNVLVSNGLMVTATGESGNYELPSDDSFVFITTPSAYTPTSPWYRSIANGRFDFALQHTPEKDTSEFTFIQMTDIHLDTETENVAFFDQAVGEFNKIAPAFVIATGDLVNGADGVTITQAEMWFDAYQNSISRLDMPIYNALGNHDVVGIHSPEITKAEPGYGEEMYRWYFGPTYYSFDWGQYHCIVLDPNEFVDGEQLFRIPDSQLGWLEQDLSFRQESPLLVFFHEPTTSWESQSQTLEILRQHQVAIFSGHLHHNILMNTQGIPEQVTGALSGEWWHGPSPDGKPTGYRIVSVNEGDIDTFYKGIGSDREIDFNLPGPIVSGEVRLAATIYSEHGSILEASYQIDDSEAIPMQIEGGKPWATATALWDAASVAEGYHNITIEAKDEGGSFSKKIEIKVSGDETVPVGEMVSHFETYRGQYTNIKGKVELTAIGPPITSEGNGIILLSDGTGEMIVFAGECKSPPLPDLSQGELIEVKAVPLRFTWEFLTATEEFYSTLGQFASFIPDSLLETDAEGNIRAIRVMRLLSSSDLTRLPE